MTFHYIILINIIIKRIIYENVSNGASESQGIVRVTGGPCRYFAGGDGVRGVQRSL